MTNFHTQHSEMREIIRRHWHPLTMDPLISKFISEEPQITFKHAQSLRDIFVHRSYRGDERDDPRRSMGTFPCGDSDYCKYIDNGISTMELNGQNLIPRHYANCRTKGVV